MTDTSQSFANAAQSLLEEMKGHNEKFDLAVKELSLDVDVKLAAVDTALEEFALEIERGEEKIPDEAHG